MGRKTGHGSRAAREPVHAGVSMTCSSSTWCLNTHVGHVCTQESWRPCIQADHSCVPGENRTLFGQHFYLCKEKAGGAHRATV